MNQFINLATKYTIAWIRTEGKRHFESATTVEELKKLISNKLFGLRVPNAGQVKGLRLVNWEAVFKAVSMMCLLFFIGTVQATEVVVIYTITSKHAGTSLEFSAPKTKKEKSGAGVYSKTTKNNSKFARTMTKDNGFTPSSYVEELICKHFKNDCRTAVAVFKAESGLRANAQGWNCRYGDISTACRVEDRHLAWSVDCGIAQINFIGQECPTESFDPAWNIEKAYEWKYKSRGFEPWVAFTSGSYLRQL